jgi:calcineurin-like phosphoesterase family protein
VNKEYKREEVSKQRFIWSDQHFSHENILKFTTSEGKKVRDFPSVEHMDNTMIERYNKTVSQRDTCYFVGDVSMNKKYLTKLKELNGRKILIKGNHDIFDLDLYLEYFDDIRAYHVTNRCIISHIPVHTEELKRFGLNIHGHTHTYRVLDDKGNVDKRYACVCVEQLNYTPVKLDAFIHTAWEEMMKYRLENNLPMREKERKKNEKIESDKGIGLSC